MSRQFAHKIDTNQTQIVNDLRSCGYTVLVLSRVGKGCPDIMCGNPKNARNYLFEIKHDGLPLTKDEKEFFDLWKGQCNVIENFKDAIAIMDGDK